MQKITQAMILAAGEGTRMRPLTLTTPKPLLKVGDTPLIVWHIEKLIKAGINDIVVNANYLADKIIDFFEKNYFDANIKLSLETHFNENVETAGGIKWALAQGLLKNSPFALINGDIWTDFDFANFDKVMCDEGLLYLTDNPAHHPNGDFVLCNGMLSCNAGRTLTFAGISVLSPSLFDEVLLGQKTPLAPILHAAIAQNKLQGQELHAKWVDVGTPLRLAELDEYLKNQ